MQDRFQEIPFYFLPIDEPPYHTWFHSNEPLIRLVISRKALPGEDKAIYPYRRGRKPAFLLRLHGKPTGSDPNEFQVQWEAGVAWDCARALSGTYRLQQGVP